METTKTKKSGYTLYTDLIDFLTGTSMDEKQAMIVASPLAELVTQYASVRADLRNDYARLVSTAQREIDTIDNGNRTSNWIGSTATSITELHVKLDTIEQAMKMANYQLENIYQIESLGGIDIFEYLNY